MKQYIGYNDEDLKEEIRKDLAKERKEEAEIIRHKRLRAEVEVEELWDLYDPQKQYRENLHRWLNEWCNGSYETYLADIEKFRAPSVSVQCQHSPDLYDRQYSDYSIYGYRAKSTKKDDKKAAIITVGSIVGIVGIMVLLALWLI